MTLPPIRRSVTVSWDLEAAFRRFTTEFGAWWPTRSHSVGGDLVRQVVFEPRVGGRIYEEHMDGRRFQWGEVVQWQPPRRVVFTWHPARDAATAQDVEVEFFEEANGTRVQLTATGWERWGDKVERARRGHSIGWSYVLNLWAQRRTTSMRLLDSVITVLGLIQRFRGGVAAEIARAGGEMPRS